MFLLLLLLTVVRCQETTTFTLSYNKTTATARPSATLHLVTLNQSKHPLSVCTDGTPSGYYFKEASVTNANDTTASFSKPMSSSVWIVHLEGGGWCYDKSSCENRCGTPSSPKRTSHLCSSFGWQSAVDLEGIFLADDPILRHANKAFVPYCTSDGHMGNGMANGWQFRGQRVIQGVLRELVNIHGLGSGVNGKDTLIFGGSSAGGRGAMVHVDYVLEMLGPSAANNIIIRGFLDSPLWIDLPSINPSFPGFNVTTSGVFSQANVTHVDLECQKMYSNDEEWKCLMGQYRMPFLKTPYFISASQDDLFQIYEDIGNAPVTQEQLQYAANFANITKRTMLSLHDSHSNTKTAVFSWSCFNHAVSMTHLGFNVWTSGDYHPDSPSTQNDALVHFLNWDVVKGKKSGDDDDPSYDGHSGVNNNEWMDRCNGWKCGKGCSTKHR